MTEIEGDERATAAGEMDSGRVLALSDGVFAIAATLLVLDLRLPENFSEHELPDKLHELLPAMGGFALSYVIIGAVWLSHHRLFKNFTGISTRVARVNLLFLGSVSVLPFVTSLVRYDEPIAAQLYAGVVALIFIVSMPLAAIPEHGPAIAKYAWLAMIPARWAVRVVIKIRDRQ